MRKLTIILAAIMACGAAAAESYATVKVKNINCMSYVFDTHIDVYFYDPHNRSCTQKWLKKLDHGEVDTIDLKIGVPDENYVCNYRHDARDTDFHGTMKLTESTHVLCKAQPFTTFCKCESVSREKFEKK